MDAPVKKLRFTVCSTNTVEGLGRNNWDGLIGNDKGTASNGQPFYTVSELRIYDKDGKQVNYAGDCNATQIGDGKGIPALSDRNEDTYLHTNYSPSVYSMPFEYHYIEVELEEELSTFSFSIQTRSRYYKNLITYMGITPGTDYLPYPEQEFQLGEKVTTLEEIAEDGALFVMQGNQNTIYDDAPVTLEEQEYIHTFPGNLYMRSTYESSITPSAASVFYLIPDLELENTYKLQWLNSGRFIAKHELTGGAGLDELASWTSSTMEAAAIEFAPCDTMAGNFTLSMEGSNDDGVFKSYLGYDAYTRMRLTADIDSAMYKTERPTSFSWTIYKASIKGAAIKAQLQSAIDEAEARLEAGGGLIEDKDNGEYDALQDVLAKAKAFVADPAVKAADILTTKRELELATAAYASISVWTYIDSIYTIEELVGNGDVVLSDASDIQSNSYREEAFNAMLDYANTASIIVDRCETLADVDAAIKDIYKVIGNFWASKIPENPNVVELPFRLGGENDGLPGYNEDNEWIWESPTYTFPEMVNGVRMTVFATVSGRNTNGIPFVCINEMEFYDLEGNKIPMTASNFSTPSVANEGKGLAGLCDGQHGTNKGVHFHSQWSADSDYDFSEYFYLDITFPTAIGGFKYKQYGRGNGAYADSPKDFVFGEKGVKMNPEDIDYLNLEIDEVDPYNAQLGDQVTAAEEITDDGLYVLVGLINCAPEGDGTGVNNFYRSNKAFGQKFAADCAFTITKTGDEDGTFYIQSLADGRFLAETIDEDGWGGSTVTYNKAEAGKFHIKSHAPIREQYGKEAFDNTFVIYMYNDTVMRQNNAIDSTQAIPHPYIVFQDYAGGSGYFSCHTLEYNDWDGEGEWYIFKMTMDNPYQFWLQNIYDAAQSTVAGFEVSDDPGFYSTESAKPFTEAFVKAQAALDAKSEEDAKAAIAAVEAALAEAAEFELNPMVPGYYIIETGDVRFATKKAMCSYFNNYEYKIVNGDTVYSAPGDYSLWWATAPEDYKEAHERFMFEFIAADSTNAKIQEWLANGVIKAEDAKNAYFIRSVEVDMYVGIPHGNPYQLTDFDKQNNDSAAVAYWLANNAIIPDLGTDVGFTAEPEWPYIVKSNGTPYWFCLWSPIGPKNCFHMEGHSNGGGEAGDVLHWNNMVCAVGNATEPSRWTLRTIEDPNTVSIDNLVTEEAEGEVISESYYTVGGAAVPAPVKGINIVKKVYANGVVKSEKILVK